MSTRAPQAIEHRPSAATALDVCGSRGAILVHTAAMLVGLTAFSAFVVDYGIMWTARRQIQNAADAAALAAASSLAFDVPGDLARARSNAIAAAQQNRVWGQVPISSVTFPGCPGSPVGSGPCVQVDVFRNQGGGSPLPTVFGHLVGVDQQGVRATATAQVLYGNATTCVRPMAVPDKWDELNPSAQPWNRVATFSRYNATGGPLAPADYYEPPGGGPFGPNGTGFSRDPNGAGAGDYGRTVAWGQALFATSPYPATYYKLDGNPEAFLPVEIGGAGPAAFYSALTTCNSDRLGPGSVLTVGTSDVRTETVTAGQQMIDADPGAHWDLAANGGRGGIVGGCMSTGTCSGPMGDHISPRLIALPAFNPDLWDASSANTTVTVTRIVGFFVERVETPALGGRLTVYPVIPQSTMTADTQSSFLASVTLVR